MGGTEIIKIKKILRFNIKYSSKKKNSFPGQQRIHYSPGIPIRLNAKKAKKDEAFILIKKRKFFNKNFFYFFKNKKIKYNSKILYKILRLLKKKKFNSIAIEKIPNKGFGEAINDRLLRASKF